jgi:hypothetical protein
MKRIYVAAATNGLPACAAQGCSCKHVESRTTMQMQQRMNGILHAFRNRQHMQMQQRTR